MEEVRWGIIGCGDVTEIKSGPAFNKVPHSKLVAVMRRDAEKAADYAKRHRVAKWYSDATDLINDPDVNAIYIATPPLQHEAYTLQALAAGKPVYVEKPMSLNAASAAKMINSSEKQDVKLVVAHYRRLMPLFLKVKELLQEKAIGDVRFAQLRMLQPLKADIIAQTAQNWRLDPAIAGGGLFHDLAPHHLDLMIDYFGTIQKSGGFAVQTQAESKVADLVSGQLVFENGVVFNGIWCFSVARQQQTDLCEIYGSKGKISFRMFGDQLTLSTAAGEKTLNFPPLLHVQQPMIAEVVKYFRGEAQNPCPPHEALITMELLDSFTQA